MAANLLIVESPSKAKTLKKYLGKDTYPNRRPGEVRITVEIAPLSVSAQG